MRPLSGCSVRRSHDQDEHTVKAIAEAKIPRFVTSMMSNRRPRQKSGREVESAK